jgi:hypothetical protein
MTNQAEESMEERMTWSQVLEAVRAIAPTEGWAFTVGQVAEATGLTPKETAKWISKFVDWGYVLRGDFEPQEERAFGKRPRRIYHILKRGVEKELGGISDVNRLLDAIYAFRHASGKEAESRAKANLFKEHDHVVESIQKRFKKKDENVPPTT